MSLIASERSIEHTHTAHTCTAPRQGVCGRHCRALEAEPGRCRCPVRLSRRDRHYCHHAHRDARSAELRTKFCRAPAEDTRQPIDSAVAGVPGKGACADWMEKACQVSERRDQVRSRPLGAASSAIRVWDWRSYCSRRDKRLMNLDQWFDPYNLEHMLAFDYLSETGEWPSGFIPENVKFSKHWLIGIEAKMSAAWLLAIKNGHIRLGVIKPPYEH